MRSTLLAAREHCRPPTRHQLFRAPGVAERKPWAALVQAYNAAIPPLVHARAAAGKHLLMVDMYRALTANPNYSTVDFANTLHPNDAGYEVMAATWYAAIGQLLR